MLEAGDAGRKLLSNVYYSIGDVDRGRCLLLNDCGIHSLNYQETKDPLQISNHMWDLTHSADLLAFVFETNKKV